MLGVRVWVEVSSELFSFSVRVEICRGSRLRRGCGF